MNENFSACVAYRWLLVVVCSIYLTRAHGQKSLSSDTIGASYAETLDKSYRLSNEAFLESLKDETMDKKLSKYYQTNFKEIFEMLHGVIKDRQMAYIPGISAVLETIVKEIQAGNPTVPKGIRLILVRDNIPNAYTVGDNTLFVNMGIFYYLQNEDQVASVFCHEIGHLLGKHTIRTLNYKYERDNEAAADVRSISEKKERKTDIALSVLKAAIYKSGENNRKDELQADSIGYVLLKHTHYQLSAFTEALSITDTYDTIRPDGLRTDAYKRFFDLPNQKFKEAWMKVEDFTAYNYNAYTEKFDKDSTSAHPGGKERREHLMSLFPELKQEKTSNAASEVFKKMKQVAEGERIPNLYIQENYGEAVYLCLRYLQDAPNDDFYRSWLGKCFQKLYEGRKGYKLNKYMDQIAPKDQSQSYIQFLSFMWNLKLEELKNIAAYYYKAS